MIYNVCETIPRVYLDSSRVKIIFCCLWSCYSVNTEGLDDVITLITLDPLQHRPVRVSSCLSPRVGVVHKLCHQPRHSI